MIIGFNILPLKNAHKLRGIGSYTKNLLDILEARDDIKIKQFEKIEDLTNVDLVHIPYFDLFFHTLPIKKKFPTIVTIHDVMPLIFSDNHPIGIKAKINLFKQKLALKNCKKIITVSETSKNDIVKYLKIPSEKIAIIYEAANSVMKVLTEAKKLKIKRKFNLPDSFLLYVGDANYVKNLPFLIDGFKMVKKSGKFNDLKLILVGNVFLKKVENIDHPELRSLKKLNEDIKRLNLEPYILRPGNLGLDDLVGFYNLATIYIQPSLYEGFGLPVLESFSCGTPVISSNRGSLPEIGGEAPVYFDPTNLDQFTKVLIDVLQSRSLQDKLSKLGLIQVQKFSWEKVADETIKIYQQVITS